THLPVVVDPSHGTGKWQLVGAVAKAAVAAGADGLLIEVHPWPERALSDGAQSLKPEKFAQLMGELRRVAEAVGRSL
ncbi:MAG TPA: 3-deoxy-7-phosphoheptulonate synthase, partial [Anaerolineae bacterium]|nr:3-deoxy-7-phosphoheptulonate synthase [Anaerolineae bacterium]